MAAKKTSVEIWGINTCDTTRKTRKFLETKGVDFNFKDMRTTAVPKTLIRDLLKSVDNVKKAFNVNGAAYREGGWKDRVPTMKKEEIVEALSSDPMLIKRPVLRSSKGVGLGLDEASIKSLL